MSISPGTPIRALHGRKPSLETPSNATTDGGSSPPTPGSVTSDADDAFPANSCERRPTLVVLDWDDTLLPTSWLVEQNVLPIKQPLASLDTTAQRLGPRREAALQEVRDAISALLDACEALVQQTGGKVVVLTNSVSGWVPGSAARFFGQPLADRLAGYALFARPPGAVPGRWTRWKTHALQQLAQEYSAVISVGDGSEERAACLGLVGPTALRSVKLAMYPSPRDLVAQLHRVREMLPRIAQDPQSAIDLHLVREKNSTWKVMASAQKPQRTGASTLWKRLNPARVFHFLARSRRATP